MDESDFFADVFRRFCDEAGLSVRKAAERLGHSKSVIGGWRTGRTVPPLDEAERIDKVLGAGGRLATAARMPGANGVGDRIAYIAQNPRSVDDASVAAAGADVGRSEFVAEYKLHLIEAHLDAGNCDVAESLLGDVREVADKTGSARLFGEVARLEHDFDG